MVDRNEIGSKQFKKETTSRLKKIQYGHFQWGPYVMISKMPDYITVRMLEEGKLLKEKDSYNHKLAGQLNHQYRFGTEAAKWFYIEITPYIQAYRDGHCEYHGLDKKVNVDIEPKDLWINYMKPGDYNPPHIHGGDYSFVFFLDVPKEIHEEKKNFKGTHSGPGSLAFMYGQVAKPMWTSVEKVVHPKSGDFFMFPAMLYHTVSPFKSNVTRISISGNLNIINRDDLPQGYF